MTKTVFNWNKTQTMQPMFFGESLGYVRYDRHVHPLFDNLIDKQLSFFWRPEEINCNADTLSYNNLTPREQNIFMQNMHYQICMDSIQGRSPVTAFLPFTSLDEVELWLSTWQTFEGIHSRSYTHILRALVPQHVDDNYRNLQSNDLLMQNVSNIAHYYDDLMSYIPTVYADTISPDVEYKRRLSLYLCLNAVNALESIRFITTFAIAFAFSRRNHLTSCVKIIQLIARDEKLHHSATSHMINLIRLGKDNDVGLRKIANETSTKNQIHDIFNQVARDEKQWVNHLLKDGSVLGISVKDLEGFIDYQCSKAMKTIGLDYEGYTETNPLSWYNSFIHLPSIQVAPQETQVISYLSGHLDNSLELGELSSIDL